MLLQVLSSFKHIVRRSKRFTCCSKTFKTASRTAAVSSPTSTWVMQKVFPSEAAIFATSIAALTAFWTFSSAIFFFNFLIPSWSDVLQKNKFPYGPLWKKFKDPQNTIRTSNWEILVLRSAFKAAGMAAASILLFRAATFCKKTEKQSLIYLTK